MELVPVTKERSYFIAQDRIRALIQRGPETEILYLSQHRALSTTTSIRLFTEVMEDLPPGIILALDDPDDLDAKGLWIRPEDIVMVSQTAFKDNRGVRTAIVLDGVDRFIVRESPEEIDDMIVEWKKKIHFFPIPWPTPSPLPEKG